MMGRVTSECIVGVSQQPTVQRLDGVKPTVGTVLAALICEVRTIMMLATARVAHVAAIFESTNEIRMNGILGTRGTLMLDLVAIGMVLIVPLMITSIYLARVRRRFAAHKRIQLVTAIVLLFVLVAFEVEMRVVGWRNCAAASPLTQEGQWNDPVEWSLLVHLLFAIPTVILWGFVVTAAVRKFPTPPSPSAHSATHKFWGRIAALFMSMTAVTGLVFYYLAFVM